MKADHNCCFTHSFPPWMLHLLWCWLEELCSLHSLHTSPLCLVNTSLVWIIWLARSNKEENNVHGILLCRPHAALLTSRVVSQCSHYQSRGSLGVLSQVNLMSKPTTAQPGLFNSDWCFKDKKETLATRCLSHCCLGRQKGKPVPFCLSLKLSVQHSRRELQASWEEKTQLAKMKI